MNIGDCPYTGCEGVFALAVPDRTPAYARLECDTCKRPVWYRFSRVDPMAWTEADFLAAHVVDPETKTITDKPMAQKPAPISFVHKNPHAMRWSLLPLLDADGKEVAGSFILHVRTPRGTGRRAGSSMVISGELLESRSFFAFVLRQGRKKASDFRRFASEGDL
jgi:hypothetical protein